MHLNLTLAVVALVVVVLVAYLVGALRQLTAAHRSVKAIADGLETVQRNTQPLDEKLVTINGAMSVLLESLKEADRHLGRAAAVFRL